MQLSSVNKDTRQERLELGRSPISGYEFDEVDENGVPKPVGAGGSGIVFKARQNLHEAAYVDRAVKFFIYRDDIAKMTLHRVNGPVSDEDFVSEIANISNFNHQSLIRVVDAGFYKTADGKIPYIVTDFIEGPTLKQVIEGSETSPVVSEVKAKLLDDPDLVLEILLDIAYAISHIHSRKFAHCDIAPKNVFIQYDGKVRPILGDLGISKSIEPLTKREKVFVAGSKSWMPEEAIEYINKEIPHNKFIELQPFWDLYGFAKTALSLLSIYGDNRPRSWFEPLIKALECTQINDRYTTIDKLIERIEFLKPVYREVAKVPELSMGVGAGIQKMMPVEALTTTKRLHKLTRHPAILRLSKVPQLTTATHILPGASHTRYEHTLGVTENMRRYLLALLDESEFLEHLNIEKIETALIAAVFSSSTRFPLSNIIHEIKDKDQSKYKGLSKSFLLKDVLKIKDHDSNDVQRFIEKNYPNVDVENVMRIVGGRKNEFDDEDKLIFSLLNSSLDVRVIDFVRRDAHHLGIISGDSFKLDEILPHLTVYDHKLSLKITGVSVAEQIISLRYWLFSRVYWNRPNRTFCAMATHLLRSLELHPGFTESLKNVVLELDQRGMLEFLVEKSKEEKDPILIDLSERLLGDEHRLYKVLLEINQSDDVDFANTITQLSKVTFDESEALTNIIEDDLVQGGYIKRDNSIKPILVDIPQEPGSTKLGHDILVMKHNGEMVNLVNFSGIVKGVNSSFNDQLTKLRVMINPDIMPDKNKSDEYQVCIKEAIKSFVSSG